MSPESLAKRLYSTKTDMWAFGVLLLEIWTQSVPFPDMLPVEVATAVSRLEIRPIAPENAPEYVHEWIDACCKFDPAQRATAPDMSKAITSRIDSS
jgi:serine/threonine protein kinase